MAEHLSLYGPTLFFFHTVLQVQQPRRWRIDICNIQEHCDSFALPEQLNDWTIIIENSYTSVYLSGFMYFQHK